MIKETTMNDISRSLVGAEEVLGCVKAWLGGSAAQTADENLVSNAVSDALCDLNRARVALERQQRIVADEPIADVFRAWVNENFVSDDNVPVARSAFADVRGSAHHLIKYLRENGVRVSLVERCR